MYKRQAMSYGALARELESRLGVRACGYLPRLPECALESRHLGLVTADEVEDLREQLRQLAEAAEKTLELDALLEIARGAPVLDFTPPVLPEKGAPVRIGAVSYTHLFMLPSPPMTNRMLTLERSRLSTISSADWGPRDEPRMVPPKRWMSATRSGVSSTG